jgi:thiol:disulfide interchange protein
MKRLAAALLVSAFAALALLVAYKRGPTVYNRWRLSQVQGRQVYDAKLDAQLALTGSLATANREHKRLLVVLGGNWCQWCLVLDDLMHRDPELRAYLEAHFVVLKLDSTAAKALDDAWGKPTRHGVPVLIFVDAAGSVRRVQETVSLERWHGRVLGHDPQRVLAVLQQSR